jgi:scyllo-inositol 2-dehydrogenase (NADP+)
VNRPGSAPLDVVLFGFGLAGEVFHAPLIAATPGLRLAVVVTSDADRAARVRESHPEARILASAEAALRDAPELGLAVVATANRAHGSLARDALEAGLPVVVDKPLAATSAEARSLVTLARERGLMLSVFHNRRLDGDLLTVRRLIEQERLGRVHRFESRFERWRPEPRPGWRESADPADAGGLLFDLGSHLIDQALVLFGPVERVYAEVEVRRLGAGVDDDVFVALAHAAGVRSHLWMSALAAQAGPRMRVLGDRAAYVKQGLDGQEDALRAGARPGEGRPWGVEPESSWGRVGSDDHWAPEPTLPGAWPEFYRQVVDAVRGVGPPPVDPEDAVTGLRLIEAARRSAAEGAIVAP